MKDPLKRDNAEIIETLIKAQIPDEPIDIHKQNVRLYELELLHTGLWFKKVWAELGLITLDPDDVEKIDAIGNTFRQKLEKALEIRMIAHNVAAEGIKRAALQEYRRCYPKQSKQEQEG